MRLLLTLVVLLILSITGCSAPQPGASDLPAGDASRGATLFAQPINGAPNCSSCHTVDGSPLTGPSFKGFSSTAGTRISGVSAHDYAAQSIMTPPSYIVNGFSNLMYNQYAQRLTLQQIADLVAYLLTL